MYRWSDEPGTRTRAELAWIAAKNGPLPALVLARINEYGDLDDETLLAVEEKVEELIREERSRPAWLSATHRAHTKDD